MFLALSIIIVAVLFFRSPLASATAEAIRHANGVPVRDPRVEQGIARVTDELEQLREQITELAERVDFTERALTEFRRRDALPNHRS